MVSGKTNFKNRNSVTFKLLVPQKNDCENSDILPQRVLQPKISWNSNKNKKQGNHQESSNFPSLESIKHQNDGITSELPASFDSFSGESEVLSYKNYPLLVDEEAIETRDCYFPLDGYDYDQHLKSISDKNFISFQSLIPEELNKPVKDDEEIIFDSEDDKSGESGGEIDDDFVFQAAGTDNLQNIDISEIIWGQSTGQNPLANLLDRPLNLKLATDGGSDRNDFDDEFDRFINDFENNTDTQVKIDENEINAKMTLQPLDKDLIKKIVGMDYSSCSDSCDDDDDLSYDDDQTFDCDWDCKTVITSFGNLLNNPKKVSHLKNSLVPKFNKLSLKNTENNQSFMPLEQFGAEFDKTAKDKLPEFLVDAHASELAPIIVTRRKDETLEEKKQRKQAIHKARALIRQIKKENKILYKNTQISHQAKQAAKAYDVPNGVRHYVMSRNYN